MLSNMGFKLGMTYLLEITFFSLKMVMNVLNQFMNDGFQQISLIIHQTNLVRLVEQIKQVTVMLIEYLYTNGITVIPLKSGHG
ncbi:MAG: hypothetical protein WCP10_06115 [Desulfuromonadales bacterium]